MSYKTYSNYKESNIKWCNEIPDNWNIQKLKFLSQNKDNERVPVSAGDREEGQYPYYGATGIVDYVNDYIFNENLLLVGEDGAPFFDSNKEVAFLISGKTWVNNHAHVLKINQTTILDKMVMHSLNCTDYSIYIKGSTRDKLNQEQLKNIPIIIPPMNEQQQIVNYLDKKTAKINATIAKNEELIRLLEEKRVALINQVVTKGLNPDVAMKDSGVKWIGEIPEHWDINKLKVLLNNLTDGSHSSVEILTEGYPYVTVMDLDETNENVDITNCKRISKEDYDLLVRNGCKPKIGDILFSQIGTIGLVVPVDNFDDYVLLSSVAILTISKNVDRRWLIYFLRSLVIKEQWKQLLAGGAVKRITLQHIANFTIVVPPISEQKQIAKHLDNETSKIIKTISKIKENIALLEEFKTSLIHHVVTGKIDVRGEEI